MLVCPVCKNSYPTGTLCPTDGTELVRLGSAERTEALKALPDPEVVTPPGRIAAAAPRANLPTQPVVHHTGTAELGRSSHESPLVDVAVAPAGSPEARVGQLLGSYRLMEVLGTGGMGCVYRAEHVLLGRDVALKLLRDDYGKRRDAVARFFQEARAVNKIRHRNIVDVTDLVELPDGTAFIIMELLAGANLAKLTRGLPPMEILRALDLCEQICDGLSAAHAVGIVHRDLKPDNVVVVPQPDGRELVKILDFGVAKLVDNDAAAGQLTMVGSVIGTPAYMSPEQAGGLKVDGRSDVYALGAIMYELFAGQPPFRGKSFGEYVRMHLHDRPRPPSQTEGGRDMDPRLEPVILRCLEKSPSARYPSAAALRVDLAAIEAEIIAAAGDGASTHARTRISHTSGIRRPSSSAELPAARARSTAGPSAAVRVSPEALRVQPDEVTSKLDVLELRGQTPRPVFDPDQDAPTSTALERPVGGRATGGQPATERRSLPFPVPELPASWPPGPPVAAAGTPSPMSYGQPTPIPMPEWSINSFVDAPYGYTAPPPEAPPAPRAAGLPALFAELVAERRTAVLAAIAGLAVLVMILAIAMSGGDDPLEPEPEAASLAPVVQPLQPTVQALTPTAPVARPAVTPPPVQPTAPSIAPDAGPEVTFEPIEPSTPPRRGPPTRLTPRVKKVPLPAAFKVRFASRPQAELFAYGSTSSLCATPCTMTIDPADGGSRTRRTFVMRRKGYVDEVVRVDLARPPKELSVALRRKAD